MGRTTHITWQKLHYWSESEGELETKKIQDLYDQNRDRLNKEYEVILELKFQPDGSLEFIHPHSREKLTEFWGEIYNNVSMILSFAVMANIQIGGNITYYDSQSGGASYGIIYFAKGRNAKIIDYNADISEETEYKELPMDPDVIRVGPNHLIVNMKSIGQIKRMLERGEIKTFQPLSELLQFTDHFGRLYYADGRYDPQTNQIFPL